MDTRTAGDDIETTKRSEKLGEALKLLEEAAREKRLELQGLLSSRYANLRNALIEGEQSMAGSIRDIGRRASEAVAQARDVGGEQAKKAAHYVDTQVHAYPWPVIGGVAVVAFLFGFILGRNKD